MVCPVLRSWKTPQTTSGRSPKAGINSKSSRMTRGKRAKSRSSASRVCRSSANSWSSRLVSAFVTTGPLLHQYVLGAVDQPALVLERHPHDLGGLEGVRPLRVAISTDRCREILVSVICPVSVHPEPSVHGFDQRHFLRPIPLVLRALLVRAAGGNDPQAALWRPGQIERVVGDRDAHAGQRLDH